MPLPTPSPDSSEPSRAELEMLSMFGRLSRLRAEGLPIEDAIAKITEPESTEDYLRRNEEAIDRITEYMLSPEYMEKFSAAQAEPDPQIRAQKHADLKRENFARLDIQALHRVIRARNRQWKAEGVLPPDVKI